MPLRVYEEERPKVRRILLATGLCGPVASAGVALIGVAVVFLAGFVNSAIFGNSADLFSQDGPGLLRGAMFAGLASAFNWFFFYFTIPAAWLAIGVSLGRLPRRAIVHAEPYLRWGAIVGAALVAVPTLFGVALFLGEEERNMMLLAGAGMSALAIGAVAGTACAGLFLLIVRPERQLAQIDTSVFSDTTLAERAASEGAEREALARPENAG